MITVHNLHKAYGSKTVLRGVDARFAGQRLTSLIGPNGAGKTTLLMMIARLMQPCAGTVCLEGRAVAGIPVGEYARRVATLRQSPDFNLRLTVQELVAFGRFPYSRGALTREDHQVIDEAIAFLSLQPLRHAYLDELSGGQRQMAFLAMTIAQQTDYLLLDEPLNNLDIKHAVQIMRALRRLCDEQGRTVVMVVHDINFAASYADHIIAMKDGRVYCEGPPEAVVQDAVLSDLYEIAVRVHVLAGRRFCDYF